MISQQRQIELTVDRCKSNSRRYMFKLTGVDWSDKSRLDIRENNGVFQMEQLPDGKYSAQVRNGKATIYVTANKQLRASVLDNACKAQFKVESGECGVFATPKKANESIDFFASQPYRAACLHAITGMIRDVPLSSRWLLLEDLWQVLERVEEKLTDRQSELTPVERTGNDDHDD